VALDYGTAALVTTTTVFPLKSKSQSGSTAGGSGSTAPAAISPACLCSFALIWVVPPKR
jgi:hypothetical protein